MAEPSREFTFPRSILAPIETEFRFRARVSETAPPFNGEMARIRRPSAESETIAGYFSNIAIADGTKRELLIGITSHRSSRSGPISTSRCI